MPRALPRLPLLQPSPALLSGLSVCPLLPDRVALSSSPCPAAPHASRPYERQPPVTAQEGPLNAHIPHSWKPQQKNPPLRAAGWRLGAVEALPRRVSRAGFPLPASHRSRRIRYLKGTHKHYPVRSAQPQNLASALRSAVLSGLGTASSAGLSAQGIAALRNSTSSCFLSH